MSNHLTKKEIIKNIKDTENLGYFVENTANWSDKKATDNMLMKLQNEGILAYEMHDDIYINAEWITDGTYNENFPF